MDRKYRYSANNVHDLGVGNLTVRLWSAEGTEGKAIIQRTFEPFAQAGFVHPYLALMPDWHPGKDSVVGSVIPSKDVLLPSVIGGDIGCGVCAVRLPLSVTDLAPLLEPLGRRLRELIPVGTAHNAVVTDRVKQQALWEQELRASVSNRTLRKLAHQFASLGGGNHFLELQKDAEARIWVMLHSGSRYLGVQVREWYVDHGADQSGVDKRLYARLPHLPIGSDLASGYLEDVRLVVAFARASRREMMLRTLEAIEEFRPEFNAIQTLTQLVDINHNYVEREEHFGEALFVHRKGAIRVGLNQQGLVPGSMGTSSFVVEGRGNEYGFCSCAHGGGRTMSRAEASRTITRRDYEQSLRDVVCAHSDVLLDEAPAAYKNIRTVMRGQSDLVKTVYELTPLLSIKGR